MMRNDFLVPPAALHSSITDEHRTLRYAAISDYMEQLHIFFVQHQLNTSNCIALALQNNIPGVCLLLYLLQQQQNFFILSNHTAAGKKLPPFCDIVLNVRDHKEVFFSPADTICIENNPYYIAQEDLLPATAQAIFSSSGTTGTPRYICFEQKTLLLNAANIVARFQLTDKNKVLIPVPISHMYGLGAGLLPALLAGADVCLAERGNVVNLLSQLNTFLPDTAFLTPAICKMLLVLNKDISHRGRYVTAGERISKETFNAFQARYGTLINLYGSTEMGVIGTTPVPEKGQFAVADIITPLPQVSIRFADINTGEISVRHNAPFSGYIHITDDRMTAQPFTDSWFATRDMGSRKNEDGFMVAGRIDLCVNRNGFLIPLQEIEALISENLGNTGKVIVVEGQEHADTPPLLAAFLEAAPGETLNTSGIRSACMRKMPAHLVPEVFTVLDTLPVLPNGKTDYTFLTKNFSALIK
ncbi:class I adenylate-forming enzyme family protein [Chitinophaga rhizophila]|uniref:AMP-binding protein n=1 Tax=Chitinophaga rhizophila TaxID=2866212 RepID=A0ABS7G953_9BACT|nr:AMP-binding protein [Chitinophaga rhizophila]MBW8683053.1 AMP-binding protein [Chitinophaga rhizophila]